MTASGAMIRIRLTARGGGALRWAALPAYDDEEVDESADRPLTYPS